MSDPILTPDAPVNIAIVGTSGSGKSSSLEKLDPSITGIINIESKPLPFRGAGKFKQKYPKTVNEIDQALDQFLVDPQIKIIVFESFTFYTPLLLPLAKSIGMKGYDIRNFYNERIASLLKKFNSAKNKHIIMTAIDDTIKMMSPGGEEADQRKIAVEGTHKGKIESYFTVVLYTTVRANKTTGVAEYFFQTNADGMITAKSPKGMFPPLIPNDCDLVIKKMQEYYK